MNSTMKSIFACTLAVAAAWSGAAPLDLSNAQISVRDQDTISIYAVGAAESKGEQRFRWDPASDSFIRVSAKDGNTCATDPFRLDDRTDSSFTLTVNTSKANKSMTLILERIQGFNNFPVGISGITIYQGKKWFTISDNAAARANNIVARRVEPSPEVMLLLPVGGRAVYKVDAVPTSLELALPITRIEKYAVFTDCKAI